MNRYSGVVAVVLLAVTSAAGQQPGSAYTAIRGKDHPELISDATTYFHLFLSLSRTPGESDEIFAKRRMAIARQTGLKTEQIALLLATADSFIRAMQTIDKQTSGSGHAAEQEGLRATQTMVLVSQLREALGPDGSAALTTFATGVMKPTITIFVTKQ